MKRAQLTQATPSNPTQQALHDAHQLANQGGCMVCQKNGKFVVYRKTDQRPVYLGARSTPEALRTFVRRLTTSK